MRGSGSRSRSRPTTPVDTYAGRVLEPERLPTECWSEPDRRYHTAAENRADLHLAARPKRTQAALGCRTTRSQDLVAPASALEAKQSTCGDNAKASGSCFPIHDPGNTKAGRLRASAATLHPHWHESASTAVGQFGVREPPAAPDALSARAKGEVKLPGGQRFPGMVQRAEDRRLPKRVRLPPHAVPLERRVKRDVGRSERPVDDRSPYAARPHQPASRRLLHRACFGPLYARSPSRGLMWVSGRVGEGMRQAAWSYHCSPIPEGIASCETAAMRRAQAPNRACP